MAIRKTLRVYVDTSVFGGCYDPGFEEDSRRVVDLARRGALVLLISDVVLDELTPAPERVRGVLNDVQAQFLERVEVTDDVLALRDAYLEAQIVSKRWMDDATHVAAATVARADAIVSWNFQHIVRIERIRAYNQVNLTNGYGILTILSPKEIRDDSSDER